MHSAPLIDCGAAHPSNPSITPVEKKRKELNSNSTFFFCNQNIGSLQFIYRTSGSTESYYIIMRMSCNGCRVLRKRCSESCVLRPCLQWISTPDSQANATSFLAKFYGRTGLTSLISNGPEHLRPAIFKSLLYDACGRIVNPIYGSLGLVSSGNWAAFQAGLESILRGNWASHVVPMEAMAGELHRVNASGRFKGVSRAKTKRKERKRAPINNHIDLSTKSDCWCQLSNTLQTAADNVKPCREQERDEFVTADQAQMVICQDLFCTLKTCQPEVEDPCKSVELELTLASKGSTSSPTHKLLDDDLRCSKAHWNQCMENYVP